MSLCHLHNLIQFKVEGCGAKVFNEQLEWLVRTIICNTCCSQAHLVIVQLCKRLDEHTSLFLRRDLIISLSVGLKFNGFLNADDRRTTRNRRCAFFHFSDFGVVTEVY